MNNNCSCQRIFSRSRSESVRTVPLDSEHKVSQSEPSLLTQNRNESTRTVPLDSKKALSGTALSRGADRAFLIHEDYDRCLQVSAEVTAVTACERWFLITPVYDFPASVVCAGQPPLVILVFLIGFPCADGLDR